MDKLVKRFSVCILVVSVLVGFTAGQIIRSNSGDTEAASANITVSDNDQIITQDQSTSTQTITKTSTVTIKDSSATVGYILSARLSQNTMLNSTVTIGSGSSSMCTLASPCTLTTTARNILNTTSNTATGAAGDTTSWTVTIAIPANTTLGNYLLDIEYGEAASLPLGMIDPSNPNVLFSQSDCSALPSGTIKNLTDTRDNKIYKVKKMVDDRCWMIDNLAFELNNASAPTYSPAAALNPASSAQSVAQYIANATTYNTAAGQTTYLYNWCAALGDTSSNCSASIAAVANQTVTNGAINTTGTTTTQPDVQGICPAPFRLPKGGPAATSGDATTTANEFAKLDIAMGGTGANLDSANTYSLFTGSAAVNTNWSGAFSGYYGSIMMLQGRVGYWWSSTARLPTSAYDLYLSSSSSSVYPASGVSKGFGFAVRCVL